ncbi:MAG: bifunctional phosphopantothenoylcysteine decarboxylase/phosphopantothenate--cysteine ligase CoaBC [Acidimicrobiales bacterium]
MRGRRTVLGVAGGIAAYKAVDVCRRLVDGGAHVVPVLTEEATRFVGEATFSALASEPVRRSLWGEPEPIPHTRLGQSADVVVVVPATAHLIARYAAGLADDLLTATLLATRAPVVLAPAMHTEMWEHPATQDNIAVLRKRGVHLVGPATGHLAGGGEGPGRLVDPEEVVAAVALVLAATAEGGAPSPPSEAGDLAGVRVLVSAGGTREPLDPVRFLGNRSSGRQGHAIAEEAVARGASVVLVTTSDREAPPGAVVVRVETGAEMEAAMVEHAREAEVVVMAAAVADFRPKAVSATKLRRSDGPPQIVLEPVPDISAALAAGRRPGQVLVGFAAETPSDASDLVRRAAAKLAGKRLDLVVANDVSAPAVGFEHDTNAVTIVRADGATREVPLADKRAVAGVVLDEVVASLAR